MNIQVSKNLDRRDFLQVAMAGAGAAVLGSVVSRAAEDVNAGQSEIKAELVEVCKIWDRGNHNAFTDLVRFHDRWFCVFREGTGHVSSKADVRVLSSEDGQRWESAALIELAGYDLRDPKICVTPDGKRLMIVSCATVREGNKPATLSQSFVAFSDDGTKWGAPQWAGRKDRWLWRITWFDGKAYSVDYDVSPASRSARTYGTALVTSDNGVNFKVLVPQLYTEGGPTESTLRFATDSTAFCLQRRSGKPNNIENTALFGCSKPPYTEWQWRNLGVYLGGPNFIQLPNGNWIAAGRMLQAGDGKGSRTVVCALDVEKAVLTPLLTLPSGGDCSYPGLVWHNGLLWISYYSSHEGKTSIYLAKIKLTPAK